MMRAETQGVPGLASKTQLSEQEKARRWDELIHTLRQPGVRNTYVRHLSAVRRAVFLLLAEREELPAALVAELRSYKVTLDGLHLEAIDGFADMDGVLNLLPTYVTESVVGNICHLDTDDD
jgi:hypothetical protein